VSCGDVTLNVCNIDINQRVAMNSAVKAECNFPSDSGGGGGGGGAAASPGPSGAPGAAPFDDADAKKLPVTWGPFARIFDTETKQYAFMSSCCVTCVLLVVLLIFMMKSGPSGPSSQNLLAARLASI
jgi:hypothetical protein